MRKKGKWQKGRGKEQKETKEKRKTWKKSKQKKKEKKGKEENEKNGKEEREGKRVPADKKKGPSRPASLAGQTRAAQND